MQRKTPRFGNPAALVRFALMASLPLTGGCGSTFQSVQTSNSTQYVYISHEPLSDSNGNIYSNITQYSIAANGQLVPLTPASASPAVSGSLVIDSVNKFAYGLVAPVCPYGFTCGTPIPFAYPVAQYKINLDGTLSLVSKEVADAVKITSNVSKGSLYAISYSSLLEIQITQYSFGASGLASARTPLVAGGNSAFPSLAFSPNGNFAYSGQYPSTIAQYSVDGDGNLSSLSPASVSTGVAGFPGSGDVAFHPSGNYVYFNDEGTGSMSQFSIGANGTLSPLNPATATTLDGPSSLSISPSGKSLYLGYCCSGGISQFSIASDGTLKTLSPAMVSVPSSDGNFISVDVTGKFLYATAQSDHKIFEFSIGSDGTLTPLNPASITEDETMLPSSITITSLPQSNP